MIVTGSSQSNQSGHHHYSRWWRLHCRHQMIMFWLVFRSNFGVEVVEAYKGLPPKNYRWNVNQYCHHPFYEANVESVGNITLIVNPPTESNFKSFPRSWWLLFLRKRRSIMIIVDKEVFHWSKASPTTVSITQLEPMDRCAIKVYQCTIYSLP